MASTHQARDARVFLVVVVAFLVLVVFTFARTFYLKAFFDTPPLPFRLHVHGLVMTGWIVLLGIQLALVATNRVRCHRTLGIVGIAWAIAVMIVGSTTTLHAASHAVAAHLPFAPMQVMVTGLELAQMVFFAVLVGAALALRSRPDWHGRLMLLSLACLLPSALARFPIGFPSNARIMLGLDGFVVACALFDALRHRRLHPAFGYGATAFIALFHLVFWFVQLPSTVAFGMKLFA